jgi:hypothetical protein
VVDTGCVEEALSRSDRRHKEKLEQREASRLRRERRQALRAERDRRLRELYDAYIVGVRKVWAWWRSQ